MQLLAEVLKASRWQLLRPKKSLHTVVSRVESSRRTGQKHTAVVLLAGHTKNVCNGAFWLFTCTHRNSDAHKSAEVMRITEDSAETKACIPSAVVNWVDSKGVLPRYSLVYRIIGWEG